MCILLRDYQVDIVDQIERLRHPLCPLPTGGGKNVIAAAFTTTAIARGLRVLFIVHRREIVFQTSEKLVLNGVDHAIFMGSESSTYLGQPCVVASVQTLHARALRGKKIDLPPADIVIIDEAHHSRARTYLEVRRAYPNAKTIGFTATPVRGDGRGLGGDLFTDLVRVPTYRWLIDHKYLVPPIVFAPVRPDLKGVKTASAGDYAPGQLEERMNTAALVGGILEHWFKLGENRRTIVFTSGVKHSAHLQREFELEGVAAAHLDADTPLDERKRILAEFKAGDIRVICNCQVLTEGFDEPSASYLVLARPTKLLGMYRQMVGRVLRPHPESNKVDARILDHSGAVYRHGYPDDEIQWPLDPDETAVNISEARRHSDGGHCRELTTCPKCSAVRMEGDGCVQCGWKPETKPRYLEVADGQLGEVHRDRSAQALPEDRMKFYRELVAVWQHKRIYKPDIKPGWIAHKYRDRFGEWPPNDWRSAGPLDPSLATRAWIRSRDIAYARSRAAR